MTTSSKKIWIAVIAVLLAIGALVWWFNRSDPPAPIDNAPETVTPEVDETIETDKIIEETDELEETEAETDESDDSDDTSANTVLPFISAWSKTSTTVKARGYVASVVEDGGTCKFVVKNSDGQEVASAETEGVIGGTNTSCPEATIDISGLSISVPSDEYDLFLEYDSDTSSGTSPAAEDF